jgi:hypothetical protein
VANGRVQRVREGGCMFSRLVSREDVVYLLDLENSVELNEAIDREELKLAKSGPTGDRVRVGDVVMFKLAQVMRGLGVDSEKSVRYAEAVLSSRLVAHDANLLEWVENETQELFCLIADGQLARIFLRNKDDFREIQVGAVKPVLFPSTRCEINVFRVIRPVIYRARQLLGKE